ncbi:hypothetical protein ACU19_06340 [Actinobaculum suis]|nr:hypothetical protein ACU19_06340 [Actinobaculum suis]
MAERCLSDGKPVQQQQADLADSKAVAHVHHKRRRDSADAERLGMATAFSSYAHTALAATPTQWLYA